VLTDLLSSQFRCHCGLRETLRDADARRRAGPFWAALRIKLTWPRTKGCKDQTFVSSLLTLALWRPCGALDLLCAGPTSTPRRAGGPTRSVTAAASRSTRTAASTRVTTSASIAPVTARATVVPIASATAITTLPTLCT